ncbi:ribosome biogenesis protein ytm1 [Microbotryomycetes sp. JL201]|nr:ribosome biogenesis protein ytm1 [Microbotryomycetes sp. JL201]
MAGNATMLGPFLTEIGAASIAPVVKLAATNEDEPGPFSRLFDRLEQEITAINDQTRVLLEDNWQPFQEQVADGKELLARMDEEQHELADVEQQLNADNLPTLVDKLEAHSQLAQSYSLTTHTLTILTSLLSLHQAVSTVSSHTTAGSLPLAVAALRDLQSALQRGAAPWIEQTDAWTALKRWGADEHTRLEAAILGAFEACFEFVATSAQHSSSSLGSSASPDYQGSKLTLRANVAAAPKGELLDVPVLLQALEDVFVLGGGTKKVDAQVARVAKHMLKYFITPFLEANGQPSTTVRFDIVYEDVPGAKTATLTPRLSSETSTSGPEDPLAVVAEFLTFFAKNTTLLPPSPYAASFTANLTPSIQQLVISSHLAPSLPSTITELSSFLPTVLAASSFEAKFLPSAGFFAFLPKDSRGRVREEAKVVQSWVDKVDKHWAKKVGDTALERVRRRIQLQDWNVQEIVRVKVRVETDVPGQTQEIEEHVPVSAGLKQVIAVAGDLLREAAAVASASFKHPTFTPAAPHLLNSFAALLSLYRAIAPVQHHELLATSETFAIQFANDTDYVTREFSRLWTESDDDAATVMKGLEGGQVAKQVEEAIRMTSQMGKEWRQAQIDKQKQALTDSLDETDHFMYTSDDVTFVKCQKACQAVLDRLEKLAKAWKPVMNRSSYYTILGDLVNDVLQRVLDEIMDHMDISEQESIRLNQLCKQMHQVEALFDDGVTSVGAEVQVWFKFVFLSELLEASMADIMFLFDDGHLVDFEPSAIAKLVRALFSESPLRQQNLARIMQGHPQPRSSDDDEGDLGDEFARRTHTPPPNGRRGSSQAVTPHTPRTPSFASRQTRAFAPSPESVDRQHRQPSIEPETPSAPPTVAPKTTKSKLGAARISKPVLPRTSSPTPPPSSKDTTSLSSAQKRTSSPERSSEQGKIAEQDDGLDEGFDDDGWGFSPEASPKTSKVEETVEPAQSITPPLVTPTPKNSEQPDEPALPFAPDEEAPRDEDLESNNLSIGVTAGMAAATAAAFGTAKALSLGRHDLARDGSVPHDDETVEDEQVASPSANDAWGLDLDDDDHFDKEDGPVGEKVEDDEAPVQMAADPTPAEQTVDDDSELERSLYVEGDPSAVRDEQHEPFVQSAVDDVVNLRPDAAKVQDVEAEPPSEAVQSTASDGLTFSKVEDVESDLAQQLSTAVESAKEPAEVMQGDLEPPVDEVDDSAWAFDEPEGFEDGLVASEQQDSPELGSSASQTHDFGRVDQISEEVDRDGELELEEAAMPEPVNERSVTPVEQQKNMQLRQAVEVEHEDHSDGASKSADEQQALGDHVDDVVVAEEEEEGGSEPFEFEHVASPEIGEGPDEESTDAGMEEAGPALENKLDLTEISQEREAVFEQEQKKFTESEREDAFGHERGGVIDQERAESKLEEQERNEREQEEQERENAFEQERVEAFEQDREDAFEQVREDAFEQVREDAFEQVRADSPLGDVPVDDETSLAYTEPILDLRQDAEAPVAVDETERQSIGSGEASNKGIEPAPPADIDPATLVADDSNTFFAPADTVQDQRSQEIVVPAHVPVETRAADLFDDSKPSVFDELGHDTASSQLAPTLSAHYALNSPSDPIDREVAETPMLNEMEAARPLTEADDDELSAEEAASREQIQTPHLDEMESQQQQSEFSPSQDDISRSGHAGESLDVEQAAIEDLAGANVYIGQSSFDDQGYHRRQPEGGDDFVDEESGWSLEDPDLDDDDQASVTHQPMSQSDFSAEASLPNPDTTERDLTPVPPLPETSDLVTKETETAEPDLFGSARPSDDASDFFSSLGRQDAASGNHSDTAEPPRVVDDSGEPEAQEPYEYQDEPTDVPAEVEEGPDDDGWGLGDADDASFEDVEARAPPAKPEVEVSGQREIEQAPDSPNLDPVDDHDDSVAPTPLLQRTPTTDRRTLPTMTVATPWDELQKPHSSNLFATSPAVPTSQLEPSLFDEGKGLAQPEAHVANVPNAEEDVDLEAGGDDDGWGIEDDLEGLEEAPEDFVVPERVASPTRVPPPPPRIDFSPRPIASAAVAPSLTSMTQRALQMSPPASLSRGRGMSVSSSTSSHRRPLSPASPSAHSRSPARKPPATLYQPSVMFSPPRSAPTTSKSANGRPGFVEAAVAAADGDGDGWGFDDDTAEDDDGLGTIDDGYDGSANDAELFKDMSDTSNGVGGGPAVAADEDAWGF